MLVGFKAMISRQQLKFKISRHIKYREIATQLSYIYEIKRERDFNKNLFKFDKSNI